MAAAGDDDFETTPGYKAPAQVDLETLQNLDKDDEALNRWKAKLLEGAACRRTMFWWRCVSLINTASQREPARAIHDVLLSSR